MKAIDIAWQLTAYGGIVLGLLVLVQALRGLFWLVKLFIIAPPRDPLRYLPGPDASRLVNHFNEVMDPERTPSVHEDWVRRFGKTFRYHGFGAHDYRLMTFDLRAVSHVLNSPAFEKPWQTRRLLSRLLGQGVFAKEGEEHRIKRRIIGPAFTPQALKNMTPVMFHKAEELRNKWISMITDGTKTKWDGIVTGLPKESLPKSRPGNENREKGLVDEALIDVAHWVSRATFDVIGLAGFDYAFRSLEDETEEVYLAYRTMFWAADKGPGFKRIAELFFPIIEKLWPDEGIRQVNASLRPIKRRGEEIVRSKKQAVLAEIASSKEIWDKDILSLLIKANLSENASTRLSDSELLDQLSTFLFAGSDTTAISIAWALHYLALDPTIQNRLREELATCYADPSTNTDYIDALDNLPFLDAVVHETLRLAPPVHGTIRVAMKDEVIPLSVPVTLRTNEIVTAVRIRKGSYVHIPIEGLNYSKDIWGEDALLFGPDRWFTLPATASHHPGLANVMSFTFGPHACIGWRFSLLEMKVFLASLVPHFEFAPAAEIKKYNAIVTRPYIEDRFEHGPALPLRVSKFIP
ncbi:cytochrome P450 [Fomitiporia mediterranea MF3/22]|uniref:cytochrome P450 n=1 Tax=Fomitiporia mediterranea (strain MF3/22) TaxID=694068 RepID=UPI0004409488|nr:cytochrome P450 [Fomitiporia mediterranea MF3/22]EJD04362.1 cytochrome P450 [Fomitiporia mediterranea MF3/22]